MRFLLIAVGFSIANFLSQAFSVEPNWKTAFERSYFQAAALAFVWLFGVAA